VFSFFLSKCVSKKICISLWMLKKELSLSVSSFIFPKFVPRILEQVRVKLLKLLGLKGFI
jgi:hypothetical protein